MLDEPTSALDPHSETLIGESLTALKSELTLFIIAHRMSTLDICDRVMVIVDGRLVAFDTKALLQTQNSYYRHASRRSPPGDGEAGPLRRHRASECPPTRPTPRDPGLLHRRAPEERHDGALRDAAPPPADLHARRQGAVVLRRRSCTNARRRARKARRGRSSSTWRCSPAPAPSSASARPRRCICGRTPPRSAIAEVRPDARIIAILREPASFLRSLHLQFVADLHRDRERLREGARARAGSGARGAQIPRVHVLAAGAALLRARALRRAAAPLRRGLPAPSRCWC